MSAPCLAMCVRGARAFVWCSRWVFEGMTVVWLWVLLVDMDHRRFVLSLDVQGVVAVSQGAEVELSCVSC